LQKENLKKFPREKAAANIKIEERKMVAVK